MSTIKQLAKDLYQDMCLCDFDDQIEDSLEVVLKEFKKEIIEQYKSNTQDVSPVTDAGWGDYEAGVIDGSNLVKNRTIKFLESI